MTTNLPPTDADPLTDRLMDDYGPLRARVVELVAAAGRVPVALDDTNHEKCITFVSKQLKPAIKEAEAARKTEGDDFLRAKRAVDGFFGALLDGLKQATAQVEIKINSYLKAKADAERVRREAEEKAAREEAARRAAEMQTPDDLTAALAAEAQVAAAAKAAVAKPAELARTHTAHGAMATLRREWAFQVQDWTQIDLNALRPHFTPAAVEQAIRAYVRSGGRKLNGVEIYEDTRALVR